MIVEVEHGAPKTALIRVLTASGTSIENGATTSLKAAMKRLLGYRQSARSLRSDKATRSGIETIRTIKHSHIHKK
nr:hypothetical protein [Rubricella aquisinus]